jgi:hypothetical protein
MAFAVGNFVWFKRAGSTPFVSGDPSNAGVVFDSELGGRGKAAITLNDSTFKIGSTMGVPQIKTSDFPTPITSADTLASTVDSAGVHIGVREQTVANPLAPKNVSTDGIFDDPTPKALFNTGTQADGSVMDEGAVDRNLTDTLRTLDPNFPSGRPHAAVAEGISAPISGSQEFVSETIDLKSASKRVGRRTPSVEQGAGMVIAVIPVTKKGVSPDGTPVNPGDNMYWVNWGPNNPSNPHKAKWRNAMKTMLHAEKDLVAA